MAEKMEKAEIRIAGTSASVDWNVGLAKSNTFVIWLTKEYIDNLKTMLEALLARDANKTFLIARKKGVEIPEQMIRGVDVVLVEDWELKSELPHVTEKLLSRLVDREKEKNG